MTDTDVLSELIKHFISNDYVNFGFIKSAPILNEVNHLFPEMFVYDLDKIKNEIVNINNFASFTQWIYEIHQHFHKHNFKSGWNSIYFLPNRSGDFRGLCFYKNGENINGWELYEANLIFNDVLTYKLEKVKLYKKVS